MNSQVFKNNKDLSRTRRDFLAFMGKSGIAGAALKSSTLLAGIFANRFAVANGSAKRVVFVYTPMGAPSRYWLPTGSELNLATQGYEQVRSNCFFHQVNVTNGGFGNIQLALSELRWKADWTGDTIDHQIATVLGMSTPYPSLHFGVHSRVGGAEESFSWHNGKRTVPMDNALASFASLFGSGESPSVRSRAAVKQNILDSHLQALNCNRKLLSQEEAQSIDQYQYTLEQMSKRLDDAAPKCEFSQDKYSDSSDAPEYGRFRKDAQLQADIITQSLACGLTNVATLQLSDQDGNWISANEDYPVSIHQFTCGMQNDLLYAEVINELSACVAYLIKQLSEHDDPASPGTKLLDNTVVVQVSSMGYGPNHLPYPAPCVVATRMPAFNTGIATPMDGYGDTHLKVLQTVAVGMGLERYIGKNSQHCIWPCGGEGDSGLNPDLLS